MLISTGTLAANGDDVFSPSITIPFTFNYYGTLYSQLVVTTNGIVSFTGIFDGCCFGEAFPNTTLNAAGDEFIALAQTDLEAYSATPGTNGSIYYATVGSAPNRVFVVHFQAVSTCCSGTPDVTGEVQLYETTNEIKIVVGSINLTRTTTMGVTRGNGTEATVVAGRNSTTISAGAECWSLINPLTLPLKLLNFNGVNNGDNTATLNWTTDGEVNTKLFEVQRSTNGVNFDLVKSVAASANSTTKKDYTCNDVFSPFQTTYYYRLKMIDQDGRFTFSPIIRLELNGKGKIRVFPNPFIDKMVINIESADKDDIVLSLIDIHGRKIFQQKNNVKKGVNAIQVNTGQNIPKGIYLLEVVTSDKTETMKIIKE
jgi:hypothetical protein